MFYYEPTTNKIVIPGGLPSLIANLEEIKELARQAGWPQDRKELTVPKGATVEIGVRLDE